MKLHFLSGSTPLTKSFTKTKTAIEKTPYPMTWEFSSETEDVTTLREFETVLRHHAARGHCLIKGQIARPLVTESRAGATNASSPTDWLVLDLDGIPAPATVDSFLAAMGLADYSYIVQWSASYKVYDNCLRAHVFILLERPVAAPLLKQWLIQKNHEIPALSTAMELTKTNNSIRWPLDISACQNDKLIYIAPPVLKGMKDPMGKQPRIEFIQRKIERFDLIASVASTEKNKASTHKRIDELRDAAGLPKRKYNYKSVAGTEVMLKPDACVITDIKEDRGFIYFNLNGGDSWAYYHPDNKPDYIYNFKGEPTYLTKELLPEYWQELTNNGASRTSSAGVTYLAFCDKQTGMYWRGTYDAGTDSLDIYPAKNETQLRHFCSQHGIPIGDFVPEWDLVFDPHDNVRVDMANKVVNRFTPSTYMKQVAKKVTKCPPTIFKVIHHALGGDVDITEHFINWTACVLQKRDRTKTAWVMHGTQGTGKGVLTNNILRPLFHPHTASRRMEELNEKYNHFMADALMVFVDETQIKALGNEKGIMAKLKNFITEEFVPIRAMHANAIEQRNYTNWIFMSNMSDPVMIDKGDRRFNIGKYQTQKIDISDADFEKIDKELQAFHDYLLSYPMDEAKARQVMNNTDRDAMIALSETSIDTVCNGFLDGKFSFFLEQMPTDDSHMRNVLVKMQVDEYTHVLKNLMLRTASNGQCSVSREELFTIYDYVVGKIPRSPNKFTSLLKHHRMHIGPVWVNNKTVRGIPVTWLDVASFPQYAKQYLGIDTSTKTK
jgi:hypothetical protein